MELPQRAIFIKSLVSISSGIGIYKFSGGVCLEFWILKRTPPPSRAPKLFFLRGVCFYIHSLGQETAALSHLCSLLLSLLCPSARGLRSGPRGCVGALAAPFRPSIAPTRLCRTTNRRDRSVRRGCVGALAAPLRPSIAPSRRCYSCLVFGVPAIQPSWPGPFEGGGRTRLT